MKKEEKFEKIYKPWCLEKGKLPNKHSPNPTEKKLGYWRNKNRKWEVLKEFNSQFNPKECKSKEKVFIENYKPWCLDHKKLPSQTSLNPIEKRLGVWRNKNNKWNKLIQFNILFSIFYGR